MKCEKCGKELKCLGELLDDEQKNYLFIQSKNRVVETALSKDIVNYKEMTPEQVYSYFKSVFDLKAEAMFLEIENLKNISKRLNCEDLQSLVIIENKIYEHPRG